MKKTLITLLAIASVGCTSLDIKELEGKYEEPMYIANRERGYCDEKAMRLSKELTKRDLPHKVVAGFIYQGSKDFHAWVEINKGTNRYVLDPSWKRILKNPKGRYFQDKSKQAVWEAVRDYQKNKEY